jgi:hypothetical protein
MNEVQKNNFTQLLYFHTPVALFMEEETQLGLCVPNNRFWHSVDEEEIFASTRNRTAPVS